MKFWTKKQKYLTYWEFGISVPQTQTRPNFKTHKTFVLHRFLWHNSSIPYLHYIHIIIFKGFCFDQVHSHSLQSLAEIYETSAKREFSELNLKFGNKNSWVLIFNLTNQNNYLPMLGVNHSRFTRTLFQSCSEFEKPFLLHITFWHLLITHNCLKYLHKNSRYGWLFKQTKFKI